jgi:septal ring factor EnvC (AmiA/AmiB activator)
MYVPCHDRVSIAPLDLVLTRRFTDERDRSKFEELHRSIRACDDILNSVETNLTSFRNDLAAVSADIESLQARSTALTVRLENRKAVERGLGPVVEELSVSPDMVSKISEAHIDESWVKLLSELDKRTVAHKKNAAQTESKAMADLGPLLEKLTLKVGSEPASYSCES